MTMHEDLKSEVRSAVVPCSELKAAMDRIVLARGKVLAVVPVPSGYQVLSQHDKKVPREHYFNIHALIEELKKIPAERPDRPSMDYRMQVDGKIQPWIMAYAPARLAELLNPGQNALHILAAEEVAYLLVRAYQAGRFEASEPT